MIIMERVHADHSNRRNNLDDVDDDDNSTVSSMSTLSSRSTRLSMMAPGQGLVQGNKAHMRYGDDFASLGEHVDEYSRDAVSQAVKAMQNALEQLPMHEKEALLEAKTKAERLVKQETPFEELLRFEKLHPMNAAKRLCQYWQIRRKAFGETNAHRSMTLLGAMKSSESLLVECHTMLLPHDSYGRGILFMDGAQPFDQDACTQLLLFFTHVLKRQRAVKQNGWVLLYNTKPNAAGSAADKSRLEMILRICNDVLPISNHGIHIFRGAKAENEVVDNDNHVATSPEQPKFVTHHLGDDGTYKESMQLHGLDLENTSTALGGDYTADQCLEWLASLEYNEQRRKHDLRDHLQLKLAQAQANWKT